MTLTLSSKIVFVSACATGVSLIEVATTVVVLLVTVLVPSLTLMVKVVVSVDPGATRLAVGVNTRPRIAVVAAAALPLKVYTPVPVL